MFAYPRRSTPRVRDGKVQRKNRHAPTPNCYNTLLPEPAIDRRRPGRGYCHLVRKEHLRRFVRLIPNWRELSAGLKVLLLAEGDGGWMGWHRRGMVAICAWERDIVISGADEWFYREHQGLLQKLAVPCVRSGTNWELQFTENTARAFQLIHVLIHELGHHHDLMTTRSKIEASRGEEYAEAYARRFEDLILARYRREFAL